MKRRIILFDIDGTLFDSASFLDDFCKQISNQFDISQVDIETVKNIYSENKKDDYFRPAAFLETVAKKFPSIKLGSLNKIFWNIDLFEKNVYKDAPNINGLVNVVLGIFSKGDEEFQKRKIKSIKDLVDVNIHIFKDKIKKLGEVLEKYKDYEIYLVDNEIEVLQRAKTLNSNVFAILIDRNGIEQTDKEITKIKSLEELKEIL